MKSKTLKVFTAVFTFLLLCSNAATSKMIAPPVSEDSIKAQMVRDWERAKAYTKEYLDAMPEDGTSFKPNPEIRSFAEQMLHLSQVIIGIVSSATGKDKIYDGKSLEKMDEYKNKAALSKIVMESYDYAIASIKGFDATKFSEMVKIFNFDMSRLTGLNKAFEHQTHHRGQCTIYIRMKGIKPPNEKLF